MNKKKSVEEIECEFIKKINEITASFMEEVKEIFEKAIKSAK